MSDQRDRGAVGESQTDLEPSPLPGGDATQPLQSGAVLAGRYEIRKVIGRGGMGLVVEALDRTLGEAVAIKILRAEYAGERTWSERLAREVKLARQIHHPNVCRVFDFEQADGRVFLIMELTPHGSLRDEVRSGATTGRSVADRIADVRALAAGLAAIHDAGIIHRDVTPQNVLRMADGRVVLSDFGLATDSWESTTSVHGGTIAYMAPELLRGGRASVASDVWALGVVSHEIVFGERPHWRPGATEMSNPIAGRRLTPPERAILEICRDCTAQDPERRPRKVAEIADRLSDARIQRATWRRWGFRAVAAACVGIATMGGVAGLRRLHARGSQQAAVIDPLLIVPTGEPDDWTDKSKVLAQVPDKIRCTSLLPDHRTIRFVWGRPPHAEDVDTHTGERKPSPLVPEAYAEGCPDVSPDGRRMVYTGHTADGRAFAFLSTHADGSGGVPVVPIAEPSMNSDPTWLPDGESFSYEFDAENMAVFSLSTNRSTILPRPLLGASSSIFRHVAGKRIFVTAQVNLTAVELVGFGWPSLNEEIRFRLPVSVLDLQSGDGKTYYCSTPARGRSTPLIAVTPTRREARRIGSIQDRYIRYPIVVGDGLSFASIGRSSNLAIRDS
ncbi:MAG TPA: protein kinase, partial [Polyangia bacterium]